MAGWSSHVDQVAMNDCAASFSAKHHKTFSLHNEGITCPSTTASRLCIQADTFAALAAWYEFTVCEFASDMQMRANIHTT